MSFLTEVKTREKNLNDYNQFLSPKEKKQIISKAEKISRKKILHINATSKGGGVAEILQSLVPLQKAIGLKVKWLEISAPQKFFYITKKIHNGLQGKNIQLTSKELDFYFSVNQQLAKSLSKFKPDLVIIHDPQPLAIIKFWHNSPMILRIHIDLSTPYQKILNHFNQLIEKYEMLVLSLKEFNHYKFIKNKISFIPPAIDPLTEKNKALPEKKAKQILSQFNIHPDHPLIAQISRFDPWKDPLGVIKSYYLAKKEITNLQLILLGLALAQDDPEAEKIFKQVKKHAKGDPDIFLFYKPINQKIENDLLVNAVQTSSDIILQKSVREGFGLSVTEAMWKEKPVIGGNSAGIKFQIKNGQNGFIVKNPEEAAKKIIYLLKHPEIGKKIGKNAKKTVKAKFLITRLLNDYLNLYLENLKL